MGMTTDPAGLATTPRRIQLRRTKGWRMPPNTVSVARPTKWGNPFRASRFTGVSKERAVEAFREWMGGHRLVNGFQRAPTTTIVQEQLRGMNLACWCPLGEACHADVLLEIANA